MVAGKGYPAVVYKVDVANTDDVDTGDGNNLCNNRCIAGQGDSVDL
jgi:hypothetical protein